MPFLRTIKLSYECSPKGRRFFRYPGRVYSGLPANKKAVAEGLIVEAARLRVLLDELFEDIRENGATELFTQSEKTAPYEKERPAAKLYATYNKNYQSIIKQLNDLTPPETKTGGKLGAFMNDD